MTITDISISQESQDRYLTYALSVVSSRALPDVRDGLKPVQRRILYAMLRGLKLSPDSSHRKSATVVGEVLGNYHPHGDLSCYEAMVRMAQDFSLRYPLVDGQGNFGSLDGDSAAAYRYTEVKLRPLALEVIGEINQETVKFRANFDSSTEEPTVFPSRAPNLLINGVSGIAVGMSTSIPPHNLSEVVAALRDLLDDPEIPISKLISSVKGPDFPTGCQILSSKKELEEVYKTGRGAIRMRSEWDTEDLPRGKKAVVVTSIPYAVNKSQLVEKIASLIIDRKVPQINDVRDESTDKVRIVLELAAGADAQAAMAFLFKHTALETTFPVNMTALVPVGDSGACKPELLSLKAILQYFLDFRVEVVRNKLAFEKRELEQKVHILEGLVKIFDALDEALKIVRKSEGRSDAAEKLRARFKLTEIQSLAVVDMRIYQLSKTNINEVLAELKAKRTRIDEIDAILKSKAKVTRIVRDELDQLEDQFGDRRRCKIVRDGFELEFNAEDYVVQEDVFAIVTRDGWLKRIRQTNDVSATRVREGDALLNVHALNTVDSVAFVTNLGNLYIVRVTDFSASSGYGDPVQKLLKFGDGERIVRSFGVPASEERQVALLKLEQSGSANGALLRSGEKLLMVSKEGVGFALELTDLGLTKRTGKRVMKLRDGDELAAAVVLRKSVALVAESGSAVVIDAKEIPVKNSAVIGVSLLSVRDGDRLVGVDSFNGSKNIRLVLDSGKEKEVPSGEFLVGHRALKGNKIVQRAKVIEVKV